MDYKIGKIYEFNKTTGVGYIVNNEDMYLFTLNELEGDKDIYNKGDTVKFKAEKVFNTTIKAFFIKKLELENKSNH